MTDHDGVNPEENFSGTVLKALDILDCLAENRRPMTTQEIAKACAMSRPTTYRLLTTLMSRGLVRDDGNYRYSLGMRLLSLSRVVLDELNLLKVAGPYLRQLCLASNETANLSVLDGSDILYVGKEENAGFTDTPMLVQLRTTVGTRLKPHSTAMGKAILAYLPLAERQVLIDQNMPLKAYTNHTITDLDGLMREIDQIRLRGYSIDDREVDEGTRCVAAPIFDSSRRVIGAVSIAGPAYRLTLDRLQELSQEVVRATHALSSQLGYSHDS